MRTTIAAALVLAIAACGGDDAELSLTEPGQISADECSLSAVHNYVGVWLVDQWGCMGRASATGAMNCDATALPWSNAAEITISAVDADTFTVSIDGSTMTAEPNGPTSIGGFAGSVNVGLNGCADDRMFVLAVSEADDTFGAYATRR